jgi:regulator of cell morphogenesis and NO signaling
MFLQPIEINRKSLVADIVAKDYRTADVFRKHGIGYCCGGKWPMDMACEMRGIDADKVQEELQVATRNIQVPNILDFAEWDIDFLINYITNIHHRYLKKSLPEMQHVLAEFSNEHDKKFPWLVELGTQFGLLIKQLQISMQREEEVLFPYIRQIAHAHKGKEPYAALLVRTLRKPVEETIFHGHEMVSGIILSIRELTNTYNTPENVCISHKVVMAKLKELDNDLMQHLYLEQSILFPRAMAIEKEVLNA